MKAVTKSWLVVSIVLLSGTPVTSWTLRVDAAVPSSVSDFIERTCLDCHASGDASGGLDLESLLAAPSLDDDEWRRWEAVFRRMRAGQMPPPELDTAGRSLGERTDAPEILATTTAIGHWLDDNAGVDHPIGQVPMIRRLTRSQYEHAIRDLLGIRVDASQWLPADSISDGFDNITVEELSPLLMNRYLRAASDISRWVTGEVAAGSVGVTVRAAPDLTQATQLDGLPIGSRGGLWFEQYIPRDGLYQFQVRLSRDRDENVEGLTRPHELDLLIDDAPVHRFEVKPPKDRRDQASADRHLVVDVPLAAGMRKISVTFASQGSPLIETKRQPFQAQFNRHRHPRVEPAIYQVGMVGPFQGGSLLPGVTRNQFLNPTGITLGEGDPRDLARERLAAIARLAYRRSVGEEDLAVLMRFFDQGFGEGRVGDPDDPSSPAPLAEAGPKELRLEKRFQSGIQSALAAILVNPNFLFRIETTEPAGGSSSAPLDTWSLASRLSFFLHNAPPDDQLLTLAESGRLSDPETLRGEVDRLLGDERSNALTEDFATQWLYLRNLESASPDMREFPDFDGNLRQSLGKETMALFRWVVAEDRSILDLIRPDRMFLNERLATHYEVPGVIGDQIREISLRAEPAKEPASAPERRGGLLRHGSLMLVTSYATRTSPTVRGSWLLENIFGTPPPPPPPNIPALKEKSNLVLATLRDRLAAHRADASCAACHDRIDPLGFALENYDALGRWRTRDGEEPIDSTGSAPDGTPISNVADLEAAILARPEVFGTVLAEKLMTFALGRQITHHDAPAIRKIVRSAAARDYRFSSLVQAIVASRPFQFRSLNPDPLAANSLLE